MVDTDTFRAVMGNFATGVNVVTFPETHQGLTANAFSSVSLDPPLLLICIDHETNSYELIQEEDIDAFCVNMLTADQQHLGEYFASMRDLDEDPFEAEDTRTGATGAPIFEDSLAYADCEIWDEVEAGDHTIYIGEIQEADVLSEDAQGLTFFRGDWGSLP